MAGRAENIADYMRDADTVTIATKRATGQEHETPIWAVTVDGVPYVRSVNGSEGHWYREAIRDGQATLVTPDARLPITVVPTEDPSKDDAIDAAYTAKYSSYPKDAFAPTVAEPARRATLRVSASA